MADTTTTTQVNPTGEAEHDASAPERQPITDEVAKNVGFWIVDLLNLKPIEMYVAIGQLLIKNCYENNLKLFHAYNKGDKSLKKIVWWLHQMQHKDWNETRLLRSAFLCEQEIVLGPLFKRWRNLSVWHYVVAQKLDLDQQADVLADADAKALTVAELQANVDKIVPPIPRQRPSDNRLQETYKAVEHLRRDLDKHEQIFLDLQELGLEEGMLKGVHGAFDQFNFDVEGLILMLYNMGAKVPDEDREKFSKDREAWVEAAKRAAEARKAAEGSSK